MSLEPGVRSRKRVFLHVGSPKTGTTFLQQVLWSEHARVREQGLLLPLDAFFDHFLASLDLRGLSGRPEHPDRAVGMWDRAVAESVAWPGDVLLSHELFASATAAQAEHAVTSFGYDAEVHVVLTVRDLVRQIPAEWQEHVKHRSTLTFADFVDSLREDTAGRSWFWKVQDFAAVARRWGGALPARQVHIVTVPAQGSAPEVLWNRFAALVGLDPAPFDIAQSRSNTSLGVEQAELLRRVNAALGERLPLPGPYAADVKNVFAHRILAARTGTRLALDAAGTDFALRRSQEIADQLASAGFDVVGRLDDLVPDRETAMAEASPSDLSQDLADGVLLEEGIAAIVGLLDAHRARRVERDAALQRGAAPRARRRVAAARQRLIVESERRPVVMRARRVYQAGRAAAASRRTSSDAETASKEGSR